MKCPRSGAKFVWNGMVVTAVPVGHIRGHRSNATCFDEGGQILVSVRTAGGNNRYFPPRSELTPMQRVTVAPRTYLAPLEDEHPPLAVFPQVPGTPMLNGLGAESSVCNKESWCVLQAGHEGVCSSTFLRDEGTAAPLSGSDDFHARNAQIWSEHAIDEAELGASDALDKGQCGRALSSLVRAERKTTMASTHATQTGSEHLKEKARKSNDLVNAMWREFKEKCVRGSDTPGASSPFEGLGAERTSPGGSFDAPIWTDEMRAELANLAHLARTALADDPAKRNSRYAWHIWASREFEKLHPEISSTAAYKELERQSAWRY